MVRTRVPSTHPASYCSASLFQFFLCHLNLPYIFLLSLFKRLRRFSMRKTILHIHSLGGSTEIASYHHRHSALASLLFSSGPGGIVYYLSHFKILDWFTCWFIQWLIARMHYTFTAETNVRCHSNRPRLPCRWRC